MHNLVKLADLAISKCEVLTTEGKENREGKNIASQMNEKNKRGASTYTITERLAVRFSKPVFYSP